VAAAGDPRSWKARGSSEAGGDDDDTGERDIVRKALVTAASAMTTGHGGR